MITFLLWSTVTSQNIEYFSDERLTVYFDIQFFLG